MAARGAVLPTREGDCGARTYARRLKRIQQRKGELMRRLFLLAAVAVIGLPHLAAAACTKCAATQVTTANAAKLLFGGSDVAGGINDWYLPNKKVDAIIDDIGTV